MWVRPLGTVPFRPRPARSLTSVICALVLLSCGDIEVNPGPESPSQSFGSSQFINFGVLNIRSVVHKAPSLHDIINYFQLDVIALTETWIDDDAPPAIKNDVAPDGYSVLHVHRAAVLGGSTRGGGLAVVHRNTLPVRVHPLSTSTIAHTTYDRQIVKLVLPSSFIIIVNIYRPPAGSNASFIEELADLIASIVANTNDKLLLCGDFNCPASDGSHVDDDLQSLLKSFGLDLLDHEPTRG